MAGKSRAGGVPGGRMEPHSLLARRARAERRIYHLLIAPALLLLLVFYVFPVARVLWISVSEPHPGLANYAELASCSVLRVLATTVEICTLTTGITVLLSYLAAYAITHSSPRIRRIMLLGVILPLWISVLVRSFAWFALLRRQGVINAVLLQLGLINEPLALMWNALGV
ncbi:MAG TPA: hypothetical protein VEC75_09505, partial [Stellaceae bacterium]|nr:hypothetical protein [Stellaceae bacterium]